MYNSGVLGRLEDVLTHVDVVQGGDEGRALVKVFSHSPSVLRISGVISVISQTNITASQSQFLIVFLMTPIVSFRSSKL